MNFKIISALCLSGLTVLCGCNSNSQYYNEKTEYPIGVMLPISNEFQKPSQEIINGMNIAVEQLNANGGLLGFDLKLIITDSAPENGDFYSNLNSLKRKGVRVFNIGFDKEIALRIETLASNTDIFINYLASYAPATLHATNTTRIFLSAINQGDTMATTETRQPDDISQHQLVIMSVDDYFGKSNGDYLNFILKNDQTKLYRDIFTMGESRFDIFSEQIMRLFSKKVFYMGYGNEINEFCNSLNKCGYKNDIVANCTLFEINADDISNDVSLLKVETLFAQDKIDTKISKDFIKAYKEKFGTSPTWKSAYGYDSIVLLKQAIESARFLPSKMREFFINKTFNCAVGKLEFDSTADSSSEVSIIKIK